MISAPVARNPPRGGVISERRRLQSAELKGDPGVASKTADGSRSLIAQRARVFDHLFDAVVVTDLAGTIIDWNAGAVRLYGYERAEALGQPVSMLHAPEDVERITAEVFAAIEATGAWTGEIRRRGRDGGIGWIESCVVPVVGDEGAPIGAIGVNRDITERKRAEQQLRDAEARWRALLEVSADAIIVTDADGAIALVNGRAEGLFGYAREDLLGQPVEVLLPERLRAPHREHRARFMVAPTAAPMGGRLDLAGRHKDGHEIPLEIGLSLLNTPAGTWLMTSLHDLTVQRTMTERLHLLGTALAAAANGIAISDAEGVCQWINPGFTRITGYRDDEMIGRRFSKLKSGVHDAAFFADLWQTITSGRPWYGEIVNRHKLGHHYVEEQTISPVRDADGHLTHFVAVKQDVTARRAMERQLIDANDKLSAQLAEIEGLQAQLREQALRDPLTGLYNRRFLAEAIDRELARAEREGRALALAVLDLDRFKRINDTYGHRAGDAVLCAAAALLG
jgi:PAS domain S-box-containing protein